MVQKNWLFLFSWLLFFDYQMIDARHVRSMTVMVQEEFVDGIDFIHTLKSDQGKVEEKFVIDGKSVEKDNFYEELETAYLSELRKKREKEDVKKLSKLQFADQAQVQVLEKIVAKLLHETDQQVKRLEHEQLKQYYEFNDSSIQSISHLLEIKEYLENAQQELVELVAEHDLVALQEMIDKVDPFSDKLETCFKNSVNNAIKHSDDTAMLKELLAMVSAV